MAKTFPSSQEELDEINSYLATLTPQGILQWSLDNLRGLHQMTAFGLTGLATLDMLSKITDVPPPLVFIDTLHHFSETYELIERVEKRYKTAFVHVYKPLGCERVEDFEAKHGLRLWETDEDKYDFLVKVEPARRAYGELGVKAVITGRRASQGGDRTSLKALEVDSTGLIKINPLFQWDFQAVESYINVHKVPKNRLLEQGYRSVGDWHSTVKTGKGAGERDGRWSGREKTECGLHKDYFVMKAKAKARLKAKARIGDKILCI